MDYTHALLFMLVITVIGVIAYLLRDPTQDQHKQQQFARSITGIDKDLL
jgi:hypothetical protein